MIERKKQYGVHRSFFLENGDQRTEPELRYFFELDSKVTCQGNICKYDANICRGCKNVMNALSQMANETLIIHQGITYTIKRCELCGEEGADNANDDEETWMCEECLRENEEDRRELYEWLHP